MGGGCRSSKRENGSKVKGEQAGEGEGGKIGLLNATFSRKYKNKVVTHLPSKK